LSSAYSKVDTSDQTMDVDDESGGPTT